MTETSMPRPVGVDELRRAWRAVQDGQFRAHPGTARRPSPRTPPLPPASHREWTHCEAVLPVLGCVGQAGASTLALAIATAAAPARVLECCTVTASGLTTAATAELGTTDNGWTVGRRHQVGIGRTTQVLLGAGEVPVPDRAAADIKLTVLDVGWETGQLMASDSWIRACVLQVATVVVVATPTIPGLRRLETALTLLDRPRALVAVVGAPRRRWPRHLTAAMGPLTIAADSDGRLITIPTDKDLALRGLDSAPLPTSLLTAAETLLRQCAAGDHPTKGQPE